MHFCFLKKGLCLGAVALAFLFACEPSTEAGSIEIFYPSGQIACKNETLIVGTDTLPNGEILTWRQDGSLLQRGILKKGLLDTLQLFLPPEDKNQLSREVVRHEGKLQKITEYMSFRQKVEHRKSVLIHRKIVRIQDSVSFFEVDSAEYKGPESFLGKNPSKTFLLKDADKEGVLVRISIPDTNDNKIRSDLLPINTDCKKFIAPQELKWETCFP